MLEKSGQRAEREPKGSDSDARKTSAPRQPTRRQRAKKQEESEEPAAVHFPQGDQQEIAGQREGSAGAAQGFSQRKRNFTVGASVGKVGAF